MKALWIAICIGLTTWCVVTHQPVWLIMINVAVDTVMVLNFLKDENT